MRHSLILSFQLPKYVNLSLTFTFFDFSCTGFLCTCVCYVSNPYNRAVRCLNNIWHGRPKIMILLITCLLLLFSFTGSDLLPMTAYSLFLLHDDRQLWNPRDTADKNITDYTEQISSNEAVIPELDQKFSAYYWTWRFITVFRTEWIQSVPSLFLRSILIISLLRLQFLDGMFSLRLLTNTLYAFPIRHLCHTPSPSHSPRFGEKYN
jgi:hypothetical protein